MRLLLIVNTTASSVTARRRVRIQHRLGADHKLEVAETWRRGHATRLARGAARDGVEAVFVLAGDGTLNEAADGLAGSATALAALPGGSTNVFARTLGLPDDPLAAAEILVASLDAGRLHRIGVGSANHRRFLFHLGIGFDAAVIERVERFGFVKRYAGHSAYVLAALDTWFRRFDRSTPWFRAFLPGGDVVGDSGFAIISNTSPYTYLGHRPLHVTPAAGLDLPLAVTLFHRLEAGLILRAAASAAGSGRLLLRHRRIAQRSGVTHLRVVGHKPFPWQVDGDHLGEVTHLDVRYEPDALTLVVP